jgi:hypothetical protein
MGVGKLSRLWRAQIKLRGDIYGQDSYILDNPLKNHMHVDETHGRTKMQRRFGKMKI